MILVIYFVEFNQIIHIYFYVKMYDNAHSVLLNIALPLAIQTIKKIRNINEN